MISVVVSFFHCSIPYEQPVHPNTPSLCILGGISAFEAREDINLQSLRVLSSPQNEGLHSHGYMGDCQNYGPFLGPLN